MAEGKQAASYETLTELAKSAVAKALERHRRLGEPVAVWQDGRVVILEADQIPLSQLESEPGQSRSVGT